MKLSPDEFEEMVGVARNYLQASSSESLSVSRLARDFAETIVQLSEACAVGLSCAKHGGAKHGQEAEELRKGIEKIIAQTVVDDECPDSANDVLHELQRLLDDVDARDSLAFLEASDPKNKEGAACGG